MTQKLLGLNGLFALPSAAYMDILFKIEIVHKSTQKYKNNKILSSKFAYPSPDTTQ